MIKKGVVFITLISILCCGKPKIVYNDYSFVKKIDKKFFTKGPTIVPEENLELYLIENENGKLVKKPLVKKIKEDEDLKKRHSTLFNYNEGNLYLLFYKDIDTGAEPENIKVYYYDKNYELKQFNDYEYVVDSTSTFSSDNNKIKNIGEIMYITHGSIYHNILNGGGFENDRKIMEGENYISRYRKNNDELKIYLSTEEAKKEKIYFYDTVNKTTKEEEVTDYIEKCVIGSCLEIDENNIIYSKGNLLIKKNLITKKEKVFYKAHNELNRVKTLNKKNTLILISVSTTDFFPLIQVYINKWKINHDVVYDLEENKVYMLETANDYLVEKEEQLRLTREILFYGLEKY